MELGLICETVSAMQELISSEEPNLLAGLLALTLLLIVSAHISGTPRQGVAASGALGSAAPIGDSCSHAA